MPALPKAYERLISQKSYLINNDKETSGCNGRAGRGRCGSSERRANEIPELQRAESFGAVFHPLSPSLAGVRIGIAPRFRACGRESEQKRIR